MGAKARTPLKMLPRLVADLREALQPLQPKSAKLKYSGTLDVDNEGNWSLGGKADAADLITLVGGVPVSVEAGGGGKHDNQGTADWQLEVDFG
jgi:hypothetical protein